MNLLKEPLVYQIQFRIEQLELFYSREMIEGIILSGDLSVEKITMRFVVNPAKSSKVWLNHWNKNHEALRIHLDNLFQTYDPAIIKNTFLMLGYNEKNLNKFIRKVA